VIFFDTETCGFHGPIVLIQWARDDGPVELHSVWHEPIKYTLELIEEFCNEPDGVCGFNLVFDWFHICQLYTTLRLFPDHNVLPVDHITQYAKYEPEARFGPCVKPKTAFDIMLHARKGPYQSTMNRKDIRIKRVPTALAWELAEELGKRIPLKDVYFARFNDPTRRWVVYDIHNDLGEVIPEFKDIVLKFNPSSALKALAVDIGITKDDRLLFGDIQLSEELRPIEYGYAPFAKAGGTWPKVIEYHIQYWTFNPRVRRYAEDDVLDTRNLYYHFGRPTHGDDDSILACMVGASRWKGYKINIDRIKELRQESFETEQDVRAIFNYNSTQMCRKYIEQVMSDEEKLALKGSTKATILESISKWKEADVCDCNGEGCETCNFTGLIDTDKIHPAAERALNIIKARKAKKEMENYDKLLLAGRFHASFNIIGTLSTRMSGADGLNPQGIKKSKEIRACFPLADSDSTLSGGDFDGFEISIADAVYEDPVLRAEIKTGKKIHGLFGEQVYQKPYEEILATKIYSVGDPRGLYDRAKRGVFALLYGGEAFTLADRLGISDQQAEEAFHRWLGKYKKWGEVRKDLANRFCSMRQPGGIGSKVEWHEPENHIESLLGFRRYFTLENQIVKVLFNLAENPPEHWTKIKLKVTRRERVQTACGAARSALFASAFAVQSANMRAAGNHVIQSTGAGITKQLQCKIWEHQPSGINSWRVQPMNIHDEVMSPTDPLIVKQVSKTVDEYVASMTSMIPDLSIDWVENLTDWSGK